VDLGERWRLELCGNWVHEVTSASARPTAVATKVSCPASGPLAFLDTRTLATPLPKLTGKRLALAKYWPSPGKKAPPPVSTACSTAWPGLLPAKYTKVLRMPSTS